MKIIVLGACCKKSAQMFENTKLAVKEMNLGVEVENIGDIKVQGNANTSFSCK